MQRGDVVLAPFFYGDGTCEYCCAGLTSACPNGNAWGIETDGGQGEAVRVPYADHVLSRLPGRRVRPHARSADPVRRLRLRAPRLGHSRVGPGRDVVVVGDGAVGLLAVLASYRLGAERIVLMGHHKDRTDLGREFGAGVMSERGEEGEQRVRDLLGTDGAHSTIWAVGYDQSVATRST